MGSQTSTSCMWKPRYLYLQPSSMHQSRPAAQTPGPYWPLSQSLTRGIGIALFATKNSDNRLIGLNFQLWPIIPHSLTESTPAYSYAILQVKDPG